MSSRRIVFFGDCQAAALSNVYCEFIAPLTEEDVRYVDATDPGGEVGLKNIRAADVVVSQVFNFARDATSEGMGPNAKKIEFPAIFMGFLWPFSGQGPHVKNTPSPLLRDGPYAGQVADKFLNKLIADGVGAEEALERYLDLDILRTAHLDRLVELHIEAQTARDERTGFEFAGLIERKFREERLFLTSSHPDLALMLPLIRGVFERLGAPAEATECAARAQRVTPFPQTALPIHPAIIRYFGLWFADERTRYPYMDEGSFTFREYVLRYVNYTWNADLVEGIALAHSPDLSRAYATLSRGLNSSPESVAGWRTMSMLLRRMRRLSEAEAAAQRAIALDLADPAPRAELTRVLLEAGKISDAEVEARRAIQIFPADGRQHALLAEVLARAGKLDEALMTAEQALALRPGDQQSLQLRSRLLIRAGDFTGAEQTLGRALRLDPVSSGLRTALADVLEQQGRREEAIGVLNNLVRENTEDPHIYGRLGHYLLRETDFAGAETAFRQASAIEPSAGFRCMLSEAIERQGRRAEAIRIVREIIAEGTQDPHVHARLGHYLLREGDAAGAEAAFREAVKIERLPGFVGMLCEAIERQGRQKEAIFILREEIAAGVRDAHLSGRLGHYLFRGGDFPAAETAFREALAIEPSSQLRGSLAETVEQQGRSDEAIEILRAAVADSEPDAHLHARLGRLLAKAGKIDAAERAYRA